MSRVTNEANPLGSRRAVEDAERALADAAEGRKRTVDAERNLLEAREQIAANLKPAYTPGGSEHRREQSIAATFEYDERMENMSRQLREDHQFFDRTYGPRGRVMVGMYDQAKRAALGSDPEAAA